MSMTLTISILLREYTSVLSFSLNAVPRTYDGGKGLQNDIIDVIDTTIYERILPHERASQKQHHDKSRQYLCAHHPYRLCCFL